MLLNASHLAITYGNAAPAVTDVSFTLAPESRGAGRRALFAHSSAAWAAADASRAARQCLREKSLQHYLQVRGAVCAGASSR